MTKPSPASADASHVATLYYRTLQLPLYGEPRLANLRLHAGDTIVINDPECRHEFKVAAFEHHTAFMRNGATVVFGAKP